MLLMRRFPLSTNEESVFFRQATELQGSRIDGSPSGVMGLLIGSCFRGKPKFYDTKFPGTYNARRDNLEGFWKGLFGYSHGILVVNQFYESVKRAKMEGRELAPGEEDENVILEFKPD